MKHYLDAILLLFFMSALVARAEHVHQTQSEEDTQRPAMAIVLRMPTPSTPSTPLTQHLHSIPARAILKVDQGIIYPPYKGPYNPPAKVLTKRELQRVQQPLMLLGNLSAPTIN